MQTLSDIRALLEARGVRPKHRLGQNFLHDHNHLRGLVRAAEITPGDLVLEVGPGTGALTTALLDAGANVIACEYDADMAAIIEQEFASAIADGRLQLITGDALPRQRELHPDIVRAIGDRPFKLVANLPYQIASALMTTLLIDHPNCRGEHVTIQKEVADRLLAAPGSKTYGPLSIIAQAFTRGADGGAAIERIALLSPGCFWPPPEVTSTMIAIRPALDIEPDLRAHGRGFARFVIELFTKRRKQLGGIVGRAHAAWPRLQEQGISADLRPEALSVGQFIGLWRAMRDDDIKRNR